MDLRPEPVDLENLPIYWKKVAELHKQAQKAMQSWHSMNFTARFLDEAQPAGPRTYIGVNRFLLIAMDNQEAFQALITTRGVTHWAQWNLLRAVFEASFYIVWILEPRDGRERRKRGLHLEVLDARSQMNWMESLRKAGLDEQAFAAYQQQHTTSARVYREEADTLGLNWAQANNWVDLVDELPKLAYVRERFTDEASKFFVSIWRRLAGFQHGFGYALVAGADKGQSIPIAGGESVYLTTNDQDLVSTCKIVSGLHIGALELVILRNTSLA